MTDQGPLGPLSGTSGEGPHLDWLDLSVSFGTAAGCTVRFDGTGTACGDWCDVLPLGGSRVAILVGDAMGRGVEAAPLAAELSRAGRLLLSSGASPGEVLAKLDAIVSPLDDVIATAACAVLDRGVGVLELANAGHPPPLVAAQSGEAYYLFGRPQAPLGAGAVDCSDTTRWAVPRGVLLFYTDGLIERRCSPLGDDMDRLLEWARAHAGRYADDGLHALCAEAVRARMVVPPQDDATVLALAIGGD